MQMKTFSRTWPGPVELIGQITMVTTDKKTVEDGVEADKKDE